MIIYVSELRPELLDDVCGRLYLITTKVRQSDLKKLVIGSAADFSHASCFVIDLSSIKNPLEEVFEAIAAFKAMYAQTRIVVIADKEPQSSSLFSRLFDMGVYDIVKNLENDSLKQCLTIGMTANDAASYRVEKPDLTSQSQKTEKQATHYTPEAADKAQREKYIIANRDFKKHKQFISVAVCATEPHMGATHHALLITKFLCGVGFKACYLEANERRSIYFLARTYAVNANERKCLIQFEGVDMYFDFKLAEVIGAGYDFYIFDLGSFDEIEATSFLTKDVKIIVGGTKAWEMPAYSPVFDAIEGSGDVSFILNFAPVPEMQNIRALMGDWQTHFSEYAPYPFAQGINRDIYAEIFKSYLTVEPVKPAEYAPEKKSIWDRWR